MSDTSQTYSDDSFWRKVKRVAAKAGKTVIEAALVLYYCLQDSDTPAWAKAAIMAALAYFIWPLDAIPDFLVGVGYSDDMVVLGGAITVVLIHIKPEHRQRAKDKLAEWF